MKVPLPEQRKMRKQPPRWDPREYIAKLANAQETIPRIIALCKRFEVCVQAGGHKGLWPKALAEYFSRVYTFEAHAANFAMLQHVAPLNVVAHHAALGDEEGIVTAVPGLRKTSGGYYVQRGGDASAPDSVRMCRVDDLGLDACDALILDVEGAEFLALCGAEQTIRAFKPLIVVERNPPFGARFGYDFEELEAWVQALGYEPRKRLVGKDVYYEARAVDGRGTHQSQSASATGGAGTVGDEQSEHQCAAACATGGLDPVVRPSHERAHTGAQEGDAERLPVVVQADEASLPLVHGPQHTGVRGISG